MPVLEKPKHIEELTLPPRRARLAADTDVLVVGGGPAGIGAALGAARAGASVILVERYGFLGGNATAALVMPLMSFHTQRPTFERLGVSNLLPNDHGPGHPVIAGALKELLEHLVRSGGAVAPSLETGYVVPFDPEVFKWSTLDLLDKAGVHFLFHAFASGVLGEGEIEGVVFETKSGPLAIKAKAIVDGTGDGDIAALAGAPYEIGRESDGLVQPMTLMFRMADFEQAAFQAYARQHPDQWRGVHGLWDLVQQATAKGELDLAREDILFFATPHAREVSVNSTRVTRVLGTDVWDWSCAEWESRRQLEQLVRFLRKYVPGFERSYAVQSGVHTGVRETRRILGDYQLTAEDLLSARKFPDAVARGSYPVDIHNPTGKGTVLRRIPADDAYDIPLRALVPRDIERVMVAGRCISGTHEAHSSYRVMPIAMATGQAAGVCAALAAQGGMVPRKVLADEVQRELVRQGANLERG
ncbi:FAD-dependent oxidoreductase [Pigmentiphaga sp. NML080357]|uniref:FAD-dependent oxidoreductase n=2 Tax=Pseudomonadota TaxID=1224 RepID=UPI000B42111B|nr:FAD-dependent oxidoreductase [Pigmentiphaga sp. NML080357]OVZ58842.1 FAD-dependent oxidoreductase [Pigmentiphaga sp. NML080357]